MENENPDPVFDALLAAQKRLPVETALDTAGLRLLTAQIRANSVFTARGTSFVFASKIKEVVELLTGDEIGQSEALVTLMECIKATGYTPEEGFPDAPPGSVPPAVRGTLQDISSLRRLKLIVRTQRDLMNGAGQQARGQTPERLRAAPAWELVRVMPVRVARDWPSRWLVAGGKPPGPGFNENAHRTVYQRTGMIALKGDPVWGELGASGNFSDALDVDHPPFCFNSGMGWREVGYTECLARKITGPNGESIEEWLASQVPVLSGNLPLPAPKLSMTDVDPELVQILIDETGAVPVPGKPGMVELPPGATPKLTPEERAERALARRAAAQEAEQAEKEKADAETWARLKAEAKARKEGK